MANVQLVEDGKIHKKRFSWLTACGELCDGHQYNDVDVQAKVTCKRCLNEHNYDFVGEYIGFGILVDRDADYANLVAQMREECASRTEENPEFIFPYWYSIKIYKPLRTDSVTSILVQLPNDEAVKSLCKATIFRLALSFEMLTVEDIRTYMNQVLSERGS